MGCFSYLCKECGKGIMSNSFRGEMVKLFYIKDGKVVEEMEGEYNSYGSVFIDGTQCKDVKHPLRQSVVWQHEDEISEASMDVHHAKTLAYYDKEFSQRYEEWKDLDPIKAEVALSSIQKEPKPIRNDWGIAAVHSRCFKVNPTTISEDDPDQGWGSGSELFADTDSQLDVELLGVAKVLEDSLKERLPDGPQAADLLPWLRGRMRTRRLRKKFLSRADYYVSMKFVTGNIAAEWTRKRYRVLATALSAPIYSVLSQDSFCRKLLTFVPIAEEST